MCAMTTSLSAAPVSPQQDPAVLYHPAARYHPIVRQFPVSPTHPAVLTAAGNVTGMARFIRYASPLKVAGVGRTAAAVSRAQPVTVSPTHTALSEKTLPPQA